jgi:hypothetical protein
MKLQEYWTAIRDRVCSQCLDGDGSGGCRMVSVIECPLVHAMPTLVRLLTSPARSRLSGYAREVHRIICGQCQYQAVNGACCLQAEIDCPLHRYYPLVVRTIVKAGQQ